MAQLRELGKTGVKVNPLGLGCMGMSAFYGTAESRNEEESVKVLEKAIDLGCTFWDTADVYGMGVNERLLSNVLKENRDKVFLCTKFGFRMSEEQQIYVCGKPDYVREAFNKSIKNLDVDKVDLYFLHRVDKTVPIEETVAAMAELVKEEKVRFLGLSECSAETLRRAYKVHPIAAIQVEYSPWTLDIEKNGVLNAARELGVSIVCYSPLGRGFLTGAIKSSADLSEGDSRKVNPRFTEENFQKNLNLVNKIKEMAASKNATPSQLTLAWVLAQGEDFIVIPGTKRLKYLEENTSAGKLKLTDAEVAEFRQIVETADIQGERYAPAMMSFLDI